MLATLSRHKASFHKTFYDWFNFTQLNRAQKRRSEAQEHLGAGGKFTRSNAASYTKDSPASCFICESEKGPFHEVSAMELEARVRKCATLLNDEKLIAKLGGGDLIALEARYHGTRLTMLYRRAEFARRKKIPEEEKPQRLEGIAMAKDSFHGTGISLFQHSSADNPGTARDRSTLGTAATRLSWRNFHLPILT